MAFPLSRLPHLSDSHLASIAGGLAAVTPDRESLAIGLGTINGFGIGAVLVPAATVALTVCPDNTLATCVALSLTIRTLGGAIGTTIYFNVFEEKLKKKLPEYVAKYAIQAGLPIQEVETFIVTLVTAPDQITKIPGVTPAILNAAAIGSRWGYAESLKYVWLTSIPFGVIAIILCLFLGNTAEYMTDRVAGRIRT